MRSAAADTARPELRVSEAAIIDAIDRGPALRPGEIVHVEVCGPTHSGSERWFVGRHQHGYMVMLFVEPTAAR